MSLFSVIETAYGQLVPEEVFYISEHYEQQECKVRTYPDWGQMVILSADRFFSINFNKGRHNMDTISLVGNYRINNDTLYLCSIQFAVSARSYAYLDTVKDATFKEAIKAGLKRIKEKTYPDIKFKIAKCENGQTLLVSISDHRFWYGVRDERGEIVVQRMKLDGSWERLLH